MRCECYERKVETMDDLCATCRAEYEGWSDTIAEKTLSPVLYRSEGVEKEAQNQKENTMSTNHEKYATEFNESVRLANMIQDLLRDYDKRVNYESFGTANGNDVLTLEQVTTRLRTVVQLLDRTRIQR